MVFLLSGMNKKSLVICCMMWALCLNLTTANLLAAITSEVSIKAQFLTRFLQFTDWPGEEPETFRIGVVGSETFLEAVKEASASREKAGIVIVVVPIQKDDSLEGLHVLFLERSAENLAEHFSTLAKASGLLFVGEHSGFLRSGGMIEFRLRRDKVRFAINQDNISAAGLSLSSKLSRIAEPE